MRAAVFLDKDGTLVENVPYNAEPDLIRLLPRVEQGLRALADAGYLLVVATNQSGVARGYFSESALPAVIRRVRELLGEAGVPLHAFCYCPHHPDGSVAEYARVCACRKPAPGLLLRAAEADGIDLARSWAVGDILDDVEAGRRAGCRTILVDGGGETEWKLTPGRLPHHVVADLEEAAAVITAVDARVPADAPRGSGRSSP
ncbi:HAD-IIIA family hydrolase [soil metagenome]